MSRRRSSVDLEGLDARELQAAIQDDDGATAAVLAYLDARSVEHSGQISGATLAAVAGVDGRTWRRWVGGDVPMPVGAKRAIICAAGWCHR